MHIKNQDTWLEFSRSSWDAAGRPKGLDPAYILSDPAKYDHAYYNYFEQKYMYMWYSIYSRVNPDTGSLIKEENVEFRDAWQRNFNWPTVWKQTLPLLVYGTTLGADNDVLVELASWYCLGQAIPSMVVDRILDNDTNIDQHNGDVAFCMLAYIKALKGIRSMGLPNTVKLEDVFLALTSEMYERMYTEHHNRFTLHPGYISDAIQTYLSPNSRLLSSVFFGILPLWSYILTNEQPDDKIKDSLMKLRTVRQLNDEVLDAKDDLSHGLLSLPWLYALEEKPELRELIKRMWNQKNRKSLIDSCFQLLSITSGRERAMEQSAACLSQSMHNTMECLPTEKAFDVTLIHNVRWALLNWLEKVDFNRNPEEIYNPAVPQDKIVHNSESIEPIPGAGGIVYNESGNVLLTLVMKRGMLRWEIPAGSLKGAESLEETAKRELLEETGMDIEIGEVVATCWHFSAMINKGWMGLFFRGNLKNKKADKCDKIAMITPQAFTNNKFDMRSNPELYRSVDLRDCDFDELLRVCEYYSRSTVHEVTIAGGFVDWKKIPEGRIHPLHRELLEKLETGDDSISFLCANADEDFAKYDKGLKLYINN